MAARVTTGGQPELGVVGTGTARRRRRLRAAVQALLGELEAGRADLYQRLAGGRSGPLSDAERLLLEVLVLSSAPRSTREINDFLDRL